MRLANWESSVITYLNECRTTPFAWGAHDCCIFANNVVQRVSGCSLYDKFAGHYTTERGALIALKRYGEGDLVGTITELLGTPIPRLQLRRGDIALVSNDGLLGLAIAVVWAGFLVQPGTHGLVQMPTEYASRGWRVG